MNVQLWLERLQEELQKRRLPPDYSARLTEELTEHFNDVQVENQSMEAQKTIDESLGSPEVIATVAQKEFTGRGIALKYRWRQKIGALMLIAAFVLVGGWIRSNTIRDELCFLPPEGSYSCCQIVSRQGCLSLERRVAQSNGPPYGGSESLMSVDSRKNEEYFQCSPILEQGLVWQWKWAGFGYGLSFKELKGVTVHVWMIPYAAFIIPMSAVSFWLLFKKSSKSNQKSSANQSHSLVLKAYVMSSKAGMI